MKKFLVIVFVLTTTVLVGILARPQSRIVGGEDAASNQFPYQVSLRLNHSHICGGSIITPNYILTASHCIGSLNDKGDFEA